MVQCRIVLGLPQKETVKSMGIDPGTLAQWERCEREPAGKFAESLKRFDAAKTEDADARRAG